MSLFRGILFPVDFSQRCADAACSVAALARQFNSKVTLIHVIGDYEVRTAKPMQSTTPETLSAGPKFQRAPVMHSCTTTE
jgi:hypothetical protein